MANGRRQLCGSGLVLIGLVAACGGGPTAARIIIDLDPGVQVTQVQVDVQNAGASLASHVEPATPRTLTTGDTVVVLFDDALGGQSVSIIVAGLSSGAEVARGTGAVTLKRGATVSVYVTLTASTACPAGQHACGATCYVDTDVDHCGLACNTCTALGSATVACVNSQCTFTCAGGTSRCGSACVNFDTDAANCGACGHACDAGQICSGRVCATSSCSDGQHACGGACVSNHDLATCGTLCLPCPTPTNSTATCDGTTCGYTCGSGYTACSDGTCKSTTATTSCGPSCTVCPVPTNGTATCSGTTCGVTCNFGYTECNGQCLSFGTPCGSSSCGTCGTGQYCDTSTGQCYKPGSCSADDECPSGQCNPNATGAACGCTVGATDCRAHETCVIATCVAS
jgi:hypothetical protein